MAENKKSFILYTDIIHTVKKLPKEKAGELFVHLLEYVNDLNPVTDDLVIELAFEPIKQSLKRDLKKYENIREQKRLAGLASAEKRKQNKQVLTPVESVEQTPTESTVSVSDSVSVSVIDNKENIIQEEILVSPRVETKKNKTTDFDFSFVNENFKEVFLDWLNYKKAKGQKYKSQQSLEICYKNLLKISNNNPELAKECIENSIANNYSGIFPVKNKLNGTDGKNNTTSNRPTQEELAAAVEFGAGLAAAREDK